MSVINAICRIAVGFIAFFVFDCVLNAEVVDKRGIVYKIWDQDHKYPVGYIDTKNRLIKHGKIDKK